VPQGGVQVWGAPDPSQPPLGVLPPGTEVRITEQNGVWAHVATGDGREGWVDGRLLVPRG
jgi:hypothetical protein